MSEGPIYVAAASMHVERYENSARELGLSCRSVIKSEQAILGLSEASALFIDDSLDNWQRLPRDALKMQNAPPVAVFTNERVKPCQVFAHVYRKNGNITDIISKVTAEKPHLLVAEDKKEVRTFLTRMFNREGYNVRAYESWREARPHLPWAHVILSDVDVPDVDGGYQLFMDALALPTRTPFVFMSGSGIDPIYAELADGAFMKPFKPALLLEVINVLAPEHLKPTRPEEFS